MNNQAKILLDAYVAHRRLVIWYRRTGQHLNASAWTLVCNEYRVAYLSEVRG